MNKQIYSFNKLTKMEDKKKEFKSAFEKQISDVIDLFENPLWEESINFFNKQLKEENEQLKRELKEVEGKLFQIKNACMRDCEQAQTYCKAIELFDKIRIDLENKGFTFSQK